MTARRDIVAFLVAAAGLAGCFDFPIIDAVPVDASTPVEASADGAVPDAATSACNACIQTASDAGGCADPLAACEGEPTCAATLACLQSECLVPGANVAVCLGQCEKTSGVNAGPGGAPFSSLLTCVSLHCLSHCR